MIKASSMAKKNIQIGILSFFILTIIAALIFILFWEQDHAEFDSDSEFQMVNSIEYEGKRYWLRDDVETLLIVGVDKFEASPSSDSYNNDKCADFLVLLVIDRTMNSYSTVYLNRDTITDVTVLGVGGQKVGSVREQLSLAHTYGTGKEDSARNTARAVSAIFGGLRIDRYITLTMDAVAVLNDSVGGVTLTIPEDMTTVDPSFAEGATVTLNGDQALRFVRARGSLADSSNAKRMQRQQQYLDALYAQLMAHLGSGEAFSTDVLRELSGYMTTNCSSGELERMMDALDALEMAETHSMRGDYKIGEFAEFYPHESSVKKILVSLFYK